MAIFYIDVYNGKDRNTVTNAVASNPSGTTVLISFPTTGIPHDYVTGMQVLLSSFSAWLNGTWTITVIDDFSFTLNGAVWQATADASGTCDAAPGYEGGSTWETAWRTLNYGARSGRIAPGDEIRISKTPDPVSIGNVYWSRSKNVILDSARTQTIFSGDAQWIVSPNVTSSRTTTASYFKYGSGCYSISPAAAFTTGKAVYYTLPSTLDLSAYQELSLFVKPNTTIVANNMRICLCSDTVGDVVVDEFKVPYNSGSNLRAWLLTKTGGGNLGSSIKSIAVYYDIDPGNLTIYLNNIIATKVNDINQSCLISKCGTATGGKEDGEGWFPVGWIDGTTVAIDNNIDVTESNRRFDNYAEETVESFLRIPFIFPQEAPYLNWGALAVSGTDGNLIKYKGGYEIGTDNQNGITALASVTSSVRGIQCNRTFIHIEGFMFTRFDIGVYGSQCSYSYFDIQNCVGNKTNGFYLSNSAYCKVNAYNMNCNGASGVVLDRCLHTVSEHISGHYCPTNGKSGLELISSNDNLFKDVYCVGSNINFACTDSNNNTFKYRNLTNGLWTGWGVSCNNSVIVLVNSELIAGNYNFTFNSYNLSGYQQVRVIDSMLNGEFVPRAIISQKCEIYMDSGDAANSPREGDLHYWRAKVYIQHSLSSPFRFKVAEFAFIANVQVTIKAWVKRDYEASDIRLVVPENIAYNISEMYVSPTTFGHTAWEQLVINFTPTVSGVAEVAFDLISIASFSYMSIGSIQITQPD